MIPHERIILAKGLLDHSYIFWATYAYLDICPSLLFYSPSSLYTVVIASRLIYVISNVISSFMNRYYWLPVHIISCLAKSLCQTLCCNLKLSIGLSVKEDIDILLPKLFCPLVRKNCSSDREKLLKFEAEGWKFAKFLRSLQQLFKQ